MYDLPSVEGLSKVVVDEKAITGDGQPLLIYAEKPKVAAARP
jgi:ATP-dependent Clp protease ATP-binding subunit ClpX